MTRATNSPARRARHKKVLKLAKGYRGRSSTCFRIAVEKVEKGLKYATRDRKARKRDFRSLWIQRINASVRSYGISYSQFINGLKKAGIEMDRKALSELAISEPAAFKSIVETAQKALNAA